MKKLILIMSVTVLYFNVLNAQKNAPVASSLGVGQSQLNVGVGLSTWGVPVYLGYDYQAGKNVSVGGEFSYRNYRESFSGDYYNHSVLGISGNVNYHFNNDLKIPSNWDLYAGLNLGFYSWSNPNGYKGDGFSGIGIGAQVGGRYYFNNKTALNLELGGGNAFGGGKFGLTFKL